MVATLHANQGETVDAICWRHYGRTAGVTEAVLEANPGLANFGAQIPQGTAVVMPDEAPQPQRQTVNLWD